MSNWRKITWYIPFIGSFLITRDIDHVKGSEYTGLIIYHATVAIGMIIWIGYSY